ncbi:hypothetical protein [Streptantibioticus silvisoli]|uniref:Secreted protein n=1 Tax=Streptantibioticus silvisoli TaxID=2705255 RepID=A0ABT6VWQ2_9ACTN|nr:hypothetical protein [Streptantibioticus silvisoli]MDI5962917.1 hypothetical protein [Streptantibioticus silvisoli]
MRLRTTLLAAAVSAAALALSLPTAASATEGAFTYVYDDPSGAPHLGLVVDPPSHTCVPLREVASPYLSPAHSPHNDTASVAKVFTGPFCDGASFPLRALGGHASDRLKLRSVEFGG